MNTTTVSSETDRLGERPSPAWGEGAAGRPGGGTPSAPRSSLSHAARCAPFVLLHLVPLAAFWTGFDLTSLLLCLACYLINVVGVTVGYHRYFAHRSYKTGRVFQFALACAGCTGLGLPPGSQSVVWRSGAATQPGP
jgi:hypothetical protein